MYYNLLIKSFIYRRWS